MNRNWATPRTQASAPASVAAEPLAPMLASIHTVAFAVGCLLIVLACAMLLPMLVDLLDGHPDWSGFAGASAITLFVGGSLMLSFRRPTQHVDLRTSFLLTTLTWVGVALFGSLPFVHGAAGLSVTDAFFEAVSGLTTTGSTVIADVESLPRGILLWRALLQWLGGLGIIVLALLFLPFLRVGGMQLFRTESSDRSEKLLPSTNAILARLAVLYLALTIACSSALQVSGLSLFEAVCHAFATISTGGYSTRNASIGAFASPAVEWTVSLFMLAGALPFMRYVALIQGRPGALARDSQVRLLLVVCVGAATLLAAQLATLEGRPAMAAFRSALFNVVSVVTTTGFASEDYSLWGAPSIGIFLVLMILGGCTGSTSGGLKMFRIHILWIAALLYVQSLITPNRIVRPRFQQKLVQPEIISAVMSFAFFFVGAWALFTVLLAMFGLDLVTAISGAATALANVGPGLGHLIGPAGNFSTLPDGAKWALSVAMLMGRLEFFTILVLLHPAFWRR
jgi:trk system potassium uptake protein TrkH